MVKRFAHKLQTLLGTYPGNYSFDKQLLVDRAFGEIHPGARSFVDLGGAHLVDGAYTFYALESYDVARAVLVDFELTDGVKQRSSRFPNLKLLQGAFDAPAVLSEISHADVTLMFDVLLHQVAPDWETVLSQYASRTDCFVIHNPQWTATSRTVRLLDLGIDEYFRNIPHDRTDPTYADVISHIDEWHPQLDRRWRDFRSLWQWGITDDDLIRTCSELGFALELQLPFGRFGRLENFRRTGFIFSRRDKVR